MSVTVLKMQHGWHYPLPFTQADMENNNSYESCPICDSKAEATPLINLGNPEWPETVNLVQCTNCDTLYYRNPPNEEQMDKFYKEIWNIHDGESLTEATKPTKKKSHRFAELLKDLGYTNKSAKILDIGCGLGNLMAGLEAAGFNDLWGTEMSPYRVKMTEKRFPGRIFEGGYEGVPSDMKFDIIYSNHVFEHMFNPGSAFVWMKEHLTENGIIIISVPDAWYEAVPGQVMFLPHLFSFCCKSFDTLAAKNDLEAMFWTGDRFWDMTCVFTDNPSQFTPQSGTFAGLSDLKRKVSGSQKERIQRPWIGNPDEIRTILVRAGIKSVGQKELDDGFRSPNSGDMVWIRIKWAFADILGKLGLRDLRKFVLKHASFIQIHPQKADGSTPTIVASNGDGVFDIK